MTPAMWRLTYTRCAERAAALVTAALALVPAIAAEQAPAPPASAAPKDDGQWTMPAKNYAATRFSELDQINGGNVANLRVEFTFSTGVNRGQEAAPLVVNNTMYIVTPYPNILFALDLTKPGAPLKWEYQPHPAVASQGVACCDVVNRGAAFWTAKSSTTRSTAIPSQWTPAAAKKSGEPSSAISTAARPSQWRRSS